MLLPLLLLLLRERESCLRFWRAPGPGHYSQPLLIPNPSPRGLSRLEEKQYGNSSCAQDQFAFLRASWAWPLFPTPLLITTLIGALGGSPWGLACIPWLKAFVVPLEKHKQTVDFARISWGSPGPAVACHYSPPHY